MYQARSSLLLNIQVWTIILIGHLKGSLLTNLGYWLKFHLKTQTHILFLGIAFIFFLRVLQKYCFSFVWCYNIYRQITILGGKVGVTIQEIKIRLTKCKLKTPNSKVLKCNNSEHEKKKRITKWYTGLVSYFFKDRTNIS